MDAHIPILKRAGMVLVVLGTCDLLAIRSGLFLLGAAAGVGLLYGSLHMASLVRWIAAFALCALGVMMLAWPLMQPVDLTLTQLKLQPRILPSLATSATWLVLLHWLYRTLSAPAVLAARRAAGHKPRHIGLAAASGAALSLMVCSALALMLHGEAAQRARRAAERQFGPDYRYHVAALKVDGKRVEGLVTAWNGNEIRNIPVAWQDDANGDR
ncbi:hypothetical protein SAMN05518865_10158 [Duganella sp. CF458]|uniref:hypothetical protein n=1 Tax=Duganella sp. CF458 TaxID=1884368 RepID=UPI0008E4794A|nr:hypothetical protein [Duganella sp. CF458]SFF51142.1 hypothetical protein SAMN05518865_10158 [Duganella sp. CF458]